MKRKGLWEKLPLVLTTLMFIAVYVGRFFPADDASAYRVGNVVLLILSLSIIAAFLIPLVRHKVVKPSVKFHKNLAHVAITVWQTITQSRWTFKIVLAIKMVAILIAILGILIAGHSLGLFRLPVVEKLPSSVLVTGKPDLSVSQLVLPEFAFPGETIDLSFKIENSGTSSSGPFNTQVFFGSVPYETDEPLGTSLILDSLFVGASGIFTVNDLPIPSSTIPGIYLITAFADSDQLIDEYDENNNIGTAFIQIKSVPLPKLLDVGVSSESNPWPPQRFLQEIPGNRVNTWYDIRYSGPRIIVKLRTVILDPSGREISNPLGDSSLVIMEDTSNHTDWVGVTFEIPTEVSLGTYDVRFAIYSEDGTDQYDAAVKTAWLTLITEEEAETIYAPGTHTEFSEGDRVRTGTNVNVRTGPGTSYPEITDPDYPGYVPAYSNGVVLSGPVFANGYIWWEIQYDAGYAGWSVGEWLEKM